MQVQWVGYGRPAAEALRAEIAAAKGDEPLRPVTVVVPSNHVGVATRRLLASGVLGPVCGRGVGVAAVTFLTTYRLAELLGAPALAAAGRRPVSTPVIAAALRRALAADPGVFAPVAAHPATEAALVSAYRELRDVSSSSLDRVARASTRASDVVRLQRAARAHLAPDWYDEEDLMTAAASAIGSADDLGRLILYLPQRLSRHAHLLLGAASDLVVIAGTTGLPAADAEVVASVGVSPLVLPSSLGTARVITTSDADEEVRAGVRLIVAAAREGTPLERIAILYPVAEPYARLVHEQLSATELPVNGPAVVPLAGRVAGRIILGLLGLPELGFRRQDVFAWMASGVPVPVTSWERLSRDAGVIAGYHDWDARLDRLGFELEARADELDADEDSLPGRADRLRRDAASARRLRGFVLRLIDDLARAASTPRRWADHADWAEAHLGRLLGSVDDWPAEEVEAATRVARAIDRLRALDAVEGPVGLDVFARTLQLELDADLGRVGRFGEGVFAGPISMGLGLDLDLVIVLGQVEGTFPAPLRDDSLLPDHERAAAGGELDLRSGHVDRQHRWLLAAMAGAEGQVLCIPRGDLRRNNHGVPSRWIPSAALRDDVASFSAGLSGLDFPATAQEHRLRSLLASPAAVAEVPGADVILARRSAAFTRFDGNVAGLEIPRREETSATRLERWMACPFQYFMVDVLGVVMPENPEDHLRIPALVRGDVMHLVLERFVGEVIARPLPPGPDDRWTSADRDRMRVLAEEVCGEAEARGLTGRAVFWRRDRERIIGDLLAFLDSDDEYRALERTRPVAAELAFSGVEFPLPDGRVVRFRGKADRVDEAADGSLHIVDYKTGKPNGYARLSGEDPDDGGTKFQLPVYGLAARAFLGRPGAAVEAAYWFITGGAGFARKGYAVTDDIVRLVGGRVGAIVDGIGAGTFPHYPTETSSSPFVVCPYCDPDSLGVADLRRAWMRKRSDPAMGPFADLVVADG